MSQEHHPVLEADLPPEHPKEDELKREEFCKEVADALNLRKGDDSIAVGITGDWGTGKTAIKNFVKHFLEKKNPKPVIIEFNPWEWSGQGKLFEAFLWFLSEALGKRDVTGTYTKLGKKTEALFVTTPSRGSCCICMG